MTEKRPFIAQNVTSLPARSVPIDSMSKSVLYSKTPKPLDIKINR